MKLAQPIGYLKNNWRGRFVSVYETDDPGIVRTVGMPLAGGDPIETREPRKDWERVIAIYPRVAVYD